MSSKNETLQFAFARLYESLIANNDLAFPSKDVLEKWELILDEWIEDAELPLLVRRPSKNRGSITVHATGRHLMFSITLLRTGCIKMLY